MRLPSEKMTVYSAGFGSGRRGGLPGLTAKRTSTMYAVIKTGGKQYRVAEGQMLQVEKLTGAPGDAISFDQVLMVGGEGKAKEYESARLMGPHR